MYGAVDAWLHAFLALAIRGEWSDLLLPPATSHPRGKGPVTHWLRGCVGPSVRLDAVEGTEASSIRMLALYPDSLVAQSLAKSKYSLKMEAIISSETLVTSRYSTLRRNSDEYSMSEGTEQEVEVCLVKYSAYRPLLQIEL